MEVGRGTKTVAAVLMLLLSPASLLAAGCGGGGKEGWERASKPRETTNPNGDNDIVAITTSDGERIEVEAEIAAGDAKRSCGLMERTALAENAGMLFVFDREQDLSFWMRNTPIPLSVAYLDSDGRIVDIQDMEPLDETGHPSAEPARYALEVNQGFFEENGVGVGNRTKLSQR